MRKPVRRNVRPTPRPKRALVRKPQRPSSKRTKLVLVTGATGKQGGALARLLLTKGFTVRAFTRKPESAPAQVLKKLGAELVAGSFDDRASLEQAMKGIDVAFIMSTPFEGGPEVEIRQGIAAADTAKTARMPHLVYTSVANADKKTGIPHFDSKYKVEQHLRSLGVPHTFAASGFDGQHIYVIPSLELVVVRNGRYIKYSGEPVAEPSLFVRFPANGMHPGLGTFPPDEWSDAEFLTPIVESTAN